MKNVIYLLAAAFLTGCALHPAAMVIPFVAGVVIITVLTLLISRWEAQARAEAEAEGEGEPVADDEDDCFFDNIPTHEQVMNGFYINKEKTQDDETSK
jgi:hypothetical protein